MSYEDPKEKIKRLMQESAPAASNVIDFAARLKLGGSAKGDGKPPAKTVLTISGNNSAGVVGDGNNVYINVSGPARPKIQIRRGPDAIDEGQAAEIKELVSKVASVSGYAHQSVYSALYKKFRVTSYHLLGRNDFSAACSYLRGWIVRGAGAKPALDGGEMRKNQLRKIHAQARKSPGQLQLVWAYSSGRFGTSHLSELTTGQLQEVIRHFRL